MNWILAARFLDDGFATDVADFLKDHAIRFEETRAFGLREFRIRSTESDAIRLADALQLLGTQALFRGEGSCLLIVRPNGDQS